MTATNPMPIVYQNKLYLAWIESNGTANQVRVVVYNGNNANPGGAFVDGNSSVGLNFNKQMNAVGPVNLGVFFNQMYATWAEMDPITGTNVIRVAAYNGQDSAPQWKFVDGDGASGLNESPTLWGNWPVFGVVNGNLFLSWVESSGLGVAGNVHVDEGF
jgi:hypothetical protein